MRQETHEMRQTPIVVSQAALVQELKNTLESMRQLLYLAYDAEPFPPEVERQYQHVWLIFNVLEDAVSLYEDTVDEVLPLSERKTRPNDPFNERDEQGQPTLPLAGTGPDDTSRVRPMGTPPMSAEEDTLPIWPGGEIPLIWPGQ
jgi:hypothetical protein